MIYYILLGVWVFFAVARFFWGVWPNLGRSQHIVDIYMVGYLKSMGRLTLWLVGAAVVYKFLF